MVGDKKVKLTKTIKENGINDESQEIIVKKI